MIKRQLNPLRIGKGLLSLVALSVMLLAPQGAWAEDYALTIAGQQYTDEQLGSTITLTSAQSTDITGGSITITRASNSDPVKLTFDNVTLSSNIVSNIDLEVYLIGGSKISYSPSVNNPDPCFKGNNNSLIFTTSETNPGTLFISKTSSMDDFASGWGGDSTTPIWDEDCDNEPNGYYWWVDQSCGFMYLKVNKKYDLEMNGSQVCDAMFKKLFPYADFPSIYMSDAQTLVVNGDYEYPITSNMSALTVAVAGKVTLSSIRFASKGSVTSGTLTISKYTNSSSNEVSLTLNNTNDNDPTIYGFSSVTIANPMSLKTPNTVPDNWNSYFDEVFISNYVSYGITVGGEEVTDKNAENIFNDVNPSAVFDNTTNTLTFNNIDINQIWNYAPFIVNGRGNLTIHIVGTQNNIKCSSKFIAKSSASASDYTVTFTTDENNGGKLTYTTNTSEFCSGHKVIFNNGLGWKISGPDSDSRYNMTIDQTGYNYNLSVAGVEVTSSNASSITGDYITGNGTVSYDPVTNTLTLDNATIDLSSYSGPGIKYTGTENFTIKLIGTNSVKVANNCEPIIYDPVVAPTPIPTLTFESGSFPCSLSLQGVNSTVIKYFGGVQGVNGLGSTTGDFYLIADEQAQYIANTGLYKGETTSSDAVTSATITSGYGILVAGELVHEGNADNVLGDELENHMVKFNATNNTLTLNDANLADGSINYSGTEDLTIAIDGNSKLFSINYVNDEVNDIPELTITKASGATDCSLALNSNGDGSVISGFSSVTWTGLNTKATTSTSIEYNTSGRYLSAGGEAVTDVIFTTAEVYPLWVGGTQVDSDNANHILGESNTSVTFTPATPATETESAKPATLTLNNATFTADGDHAIESGLENLTVFLVGKNYITKTGNSNYVFSKTSELEGATITITTDAESNGSLYITSLEDYLFGTGVTPVYTNVTIKNNGDNHTIDSNLGISVGGVPVTLFNSTDVFGDGTVSFTPAVPVTDNTPAVPAILTLNGATIECDEEQESPGIVYENEDDLTIALIGNNSIQGAAGCTAIEKRYGVETPGLSFVKGDAAQHFSLTLIADSENDFIDGFDTTSTYDDLFVSDDEDNGTYTRTISSSRALDVAFVENNLWATYYATKNLTVPEGLTAYVVSDLGETSATVTAVEYIPKDKAILLKRENTDAAASGYTASAYTGTTTTVNNFLTASTQSVNVSTVSNGTVYVLYNDMFKRATSGTIPAYRGYLISGPMNSQGAPQFITLNVVDGNSTAISTLDVNSNDDSWYTIDGLKLSGKPQHKGVYISNRKKVYFKNK